MVKARQHALKSGNLYTFRLYRNKVNRACKTLRSSYYNRNVNGLRKSNPRMWWKKTDLLINLNKGGNAMHALANRTTSSDCVDINVFFSFSIFTFRSVSSTSCNYRTRCTKRIYY